MVSAPLSSQPLLLEVARELATVLGGRVQDHLAEARRVLSHALRECAPRDVCTLPVTR